jgi:phenylalanyl-tRNA synthetase beta chain
MKISYNWLCDFIQTDLSPDRIGQVLTGIGLEVEGIEKVEAIPGGLKGVVVGEVLTCEKHPDADRLRVTTVNVGAADPLPIVCGAPNVAAGQKVLVATIGAVLYPSEGEPLTIKKGKIRGAESHGMICAEDELGLGKSHEGILVLDNAAIPGTPAADFLNIKADFCLEIGLTPNRTDAISHYGVARDFAAALVATGDRNFSFKKVETNALQLPFEEGPSVLVSIEDEAACRRYVGITLKDIRVVESPEWLKERLAIIGVRPINAVVDITNYVQHELGQPLHAFDVDKIAGSHVKVRRASTGEKFQTLDGAERTLSETDLVIADLEKPMCIAGVFGGLQSGVSENTTQIFLESAYFDPATVRKTARRHLLNTDSSFRFERGVDPSRTHHAALRAAQMILSICGGKAVGAMIDSYPNPIQPVELVFRESYAQRLIGKKIPTAEIQAILDALELECIEKLDDGWKLRIPLYRVDVTREADVVEEVLRIYGYDKVDFPEGLKSSISIAPKPDPEKVQNQVADLLASRGFSEIMGLSLTRQKYASLASEVEYNEATSITLLNPLSGDLSNMRQTLLYTALEAIAMNQNHRSVDLRLFEFGKEYRKVDGKYVEEWKLGIYITGRRLPESWNSAADAVSFVDVKAEVDTIMKALGIAGLQQEGMVSSLFDDGVTLVQGKKSVAQLGAVSSALLKEFDVKQPVWFADISWEKLVTMVPRKAVTYMAPEKYPAVRRDLSLLLDRSVKYDQLVRFAFQAEKKLLRNVNLFDVYEGKNIDAAKKSYALSFVLQDATKTMTDEQVDGAMSRILSTLEKECGVSLRN